MSLIILMTRVIKLMQERMDDILWWRFWHLHCKQIGQFLLCVLLGLWGFPAQAINLNAVYFGSCQREIGIILYVDDSHIQMLSLQGRIKSISRYNITYLAYYPIGVIPIQQIDNADEVDLIKVKTIYQNEIVDLVTGWPVDFSDEKISFLTSDGREIVIEHDSIWSLEIEKSSSHLKLDKGVPSQYYFLHPYPFSHCAVSEQETIEDQQTVYPQQLLGDPLLIKKELDHFQAIHETIRDYHKDQRFYPIPQVYENSTRLGFWFNTGSRYGVSKYRSNNFTPVLISELSEGPFGFQRILITGSAPMPYSIHEEPQTQFYYRMKADYAHFSVMYDVSRMLIGEEKYKWTQSELMKNDDRTTEISHFGGGFDYGEWGLDVTLPNIQYAIRHEELFFERRMNMGQTGLFYHNRDIKIEVYRGDAKDQKEEIIVGDDATDAEKEEALAKETRQVAFHTSLKHFRINLHLHTMASLHPMFSAIYKKLQFSRDPDFNGMGFFVYESTSTTIAMNWTHQWNQDFQLGGYVSMESHINRYGRRSLSHTSSAFYPKGGVSITLNF